MESSGGNGGGCDDTQYVISPPKKEIRNLVGFWILGLCNNYAYVIMISAAFDLLKDNPDDDDGDSDLYNQNCTENFNCTRPCNKISTGAILLADILPSLAIKLVAPMLNIHTHIRVMIAVSLSAACFIITSFSVAHWMTFLGVVCAALSSGLGEVTFLSFSSHFDKDVVSTWSSGTGGAGVVGALSYASLRHALSVRHTLQVMLLMPIVMAIAFWIIIEHPPSTQLTCKLAGCGGELEPMLSDNINMSNGAVVAKHEQPKYTIQEKIFLIKPLLKYMIPLSLVYFAEYFINQGLMELLYFDGAKGWLTHKDQYRWYQVDYQVGVLISRSSVNFFQIKRLWMLPILQFINLVFLFFEAYYLFLPNTWGIWIVLTVIFYEGLLGGSAYVNSFYSISQEIPEEHREYSLGVATLGDAMGIALAGAIAVPVHDAMCSLPM